MKLEDLKTMKTSDQFRREHDRHEQLQRVERRAWDLFMARSAGKFRDVSFIEAKECISRDPRTLHLEMSNCLDAADAFEAIVSDWMAESKRLDIEDQARLEPQAREKHELAASALHAGS